MACSRQALCGGAVVLAAAALTAGVLAGSGDPASSPAPATVPAGGCDPPEPPLGVYESGRHAGRLARLDPLTLEPLERGVPLRRAPWSFDLAPSGGAMAIGDGSRGHLKIIDLGRGHVRGSVRIAQVGPVSEIAWVTPRLAVAWIRGRRSSALVAVVDTERLDVLWRRRLRGDAQTAGEVAGGLALLLAPEGDIGPARLAIVRVDRSVTSVPLDRIAAGFIPPEGDLDAGELPMARIREPALVTDDGGRRAFVVAAGTSLVTELDVTSGAVEHHELEEPRSAGARLRDWLEPPAHAKVTMGSRRVAHWLGDGRLAISGSDQRDPPTRPWSPYGLRIADLHEDTLRTVNPGADSVDAVAGSLVVWRARGEPLLSAYERSGNRLWSLATADAYRQLAFWGCRAYLASRRALAVIDVRSGRLLRRLPRRGDLPLFVGR